MNSRTSSADLYGAIAGPPRGNGPFSIVDEAGCLTGPFNALLHSPAIGDAVQALGAVLRFGGSLPDRTRELVICAVAAELESAYEWYAHSRVATSVGVSGTELKKLHDGDIPGHSDRGRKRGAGPDACPAARQHRRPGSTRGRP